MTLHDKSISSDIIVANAIETVVSSILAVDANDAHYLQRQSLREFLRRSDVDVERDRFDEDDHLDSDVPHFPDVIDDGGGQLLGDHRLYTWTNHSHLFELFHLESFHRRSVHRSDLVSNGETEKEKRSNSTFPLIAHLTPSEYLIISSYLISSEEVNSFRSFSQFLSD